MKKKQKKKTSKKCCWLLRSEHLSSFWQRLRKNFITLKFIQVRRTPDRWWVRQRKLKLCSWNLQPCLI